MSSETGTICDVLVREKTIYDVGVGSPKYLVANFDTFYQTKGLAYLFIPLRQIVLWPCVGDFFSWIEIKWLLWRFRSNELFKNILPKDDIVGELCQRVRVKATTLNYFENMPQGACSTSVKLWSRYKW